MGPQNCAPTARQSSSDSRSSRAASSLLALVQQKPAFELDALGLEPAGSELDREVSRPVEIALHTSTVASLKCGEQAHGLTQELGSWLTDCNCCADRRIAILAGLLASSGRGG